MTMQYRRLGTAGVRVSVLSLGSALATFATEVDYDDTLALMSLARDAGVNYFDNAQSYGFGEGERAMGNALAELGWPRDSYLVSTKFFWGLSETVNACRTLNRKFLMESMDKALERYGLETIDIAFCHRSDPETPMEETVWAMSDIIESGRAHYWGTSDWPAAKIYEAIDVAERHRLRKPITEQSQYSMLHRNQVEGDLPPLLAEHGYGMMAYSPLAGGLLTGKYLQGIPAASRGSRSGYEWMRGSLLDKGFHETIHSLKAIAHDLGCSLAQLALAWCAANPNVSTVITGATRPSQVTDNMGALDVLDRLNPDVLDSIEQALNLGHPEFRGNP
jgi:voltage-dependent potassium channel beta subunit